MFKKTIFYSVIKSEREEPEHPDLFFLYNSGVEDVPQKTRNVPGHSKGRNKQISWLILVLLFFRWLQLGKKTKNESIGRISCLTVQLEVIKGALCKVMEDLAAKQRDLVAWVWWPVCRRRREPLGNYQPGNQGAAFPAWQQDAGAPACEEWRGLLTPGAVGVWGAGTVHVGEGKDCWDLPKADWEHDHGPAWLNCWSKGEIPAEKRNKCLETQSRRA